MLGFNIEWTRMGMLGANSQDRNGSAASVRASKKQSAAAHLTASIKV